MESINIKECIIDIKSIKNNQTNKKPNAQKKNVAE